MHTIVYVSKNALSFAKKVKKDIYNFLAIGYRMNRIYIIVYLIPSSQTDVLHSTVLKQKEFKDLSIIGAFDDKNVHDLTLRYTGPPNYICIDKRKDQLCTVIFFDPPNFKNLEYLTINPILLQSSGKKHVDSDDDMLNTKLEELNLLEGIGRDAIANFGVLDKVNTCLKAEGYIKSTLAAGTVQRTVVPCFPFRNSGFILSASRILIHYMEFVIKYIQKFIILLLGILNMKIFGLKLTDNSRVLKQLDLRLQQLNFFPIQFLLYYDRKPFHEESYFLKQLELPVYNSRLNESNSNYINLYNSAWLIFNDVLSGIVAWKILISLFAKVSWIINSIILKRVLFEKVFSLIYWISYDYPAGFKLNNELGNFIGDLYLWSLKFWNIIISMFFLIDPDLVKIQIKSLESDVYLHKLGSWDFSFREYVSKAIFRTFLCVLCHMGFSFLISLFVDYFGLITLPITAIYCTSSRIYQRQLEIIKSLFQLFRGKKYNVLRNRVDNLDNYSNPGQFFEVDRFLLGTLFFMVLVFLLPTVFAFYLVCFLMRLACVMILNFAENLLIVINFMPLFMIILKLKNSRRLQGGITLEFMGLENGITYLLLFNRSLTYSDIFKNFMLLFRDSKNFKKSLLQFFLIGEPISLNRDDKIVFNYLMLPRHPENTVYVWDVLET